MSFYSDASFFVVLAVIVCGAAILGLSGRSLRGYGFCASVVMLVCLFLREPTQGMWAAAFLALACGCAQALMSRPKSRPLFVTTLLLTIAPLVAVKVCGAMSVASIGFIGISYLTFRAVQVLVETHDGLIERMSLLDYLYFVAFFPTFTSGPIDRSRRFVEDLHATRSRDEYAGMLGRGILLILAGMVYKMVIAAVLYGQYNPTAFVSTVPFHNELVHQVKTTYVYGLYLFFDFAGYSMMAMGAGYCLGVRVPRNFRAPFAAIDIRDFWNRWHITLSWWLRDFVFMRLARTMVRHHVFKGKKARLRTSQVAMVANMLLMGAWHGLTADYLLYGLYHGVLLAAFEWWSKTKFYKRHHMGVCYRLVSWFVTMQLVFLGFALFSGQISLIVRGA
jgi:membrane protein involved in D-alanine export